MIQDNFLFNLKNKFSLIDWDWTSQYPKLSECFIEKYQDKVNWIIISRYQELSESFIEKFQNKVYWDWIVQYQKLTEQFIEKYQNKVDWYYVSVYQKLSEPFIEKFQDKVDWMKISYKQTLSEPFIEKFQDKVDWYFISKYQKLSESFIEKYQNKVNWSCISRYQKLSEEFIEKYKLQIPDNNWLYKTKEFKIKKLKNLYEIEGNCVIAYKSVRLNNASVHQPGIVYEVGKEYTSSCDCNYNEENSIGLSAWTLQGAKKYYSKGNILKVKIHIDDVGVCLESGKIRCFKLKVIGKC